MPRTIQHIKRWTATELRQFLLYIGPVVLRGTVLEKPYYNLFMLLHFGITILVRQDLNPGMLDEAERALLKFVKKCKGLMGQHFISYNVHNLIHLTADSRKFGVLDKFSAFPFENELQVLKHAVRGKRKPLQQLVRRVKEFDRVSLLCARHVDIPEGVIKGKARKRCNEYSKGGSTHSSARIMGRTVSAKKGDNIVVIGDKIVSVRHFSVKNDKSYVEGKYFTRMTNLYKYPIHSSEIGVWKVSNLSYATRSWPLSAVTCKAAQIPLGESEYAIFPLVN